MPTYIFRGTGPAHIADIGVDVIPGESFESPVELEGELFEPAGTEIVIAPLRVVVPEPTVTEEAV